MLPELDAVIEAFSESAVQRITETVKGIISSYSLYVIRAWELEYNDNNYYLDGQKYLGFVLGKEQAERVCDGLNQDEYQNLKQKRWLWVEDDRNFMRREEVAKKLVVAGDAIWDVTFEQIKVHCDVLGLDFWADYMPPLYDYVQLEPYA